uniref:ATP synthase complex subunit 8 n=1 Tax=Eriocheir japonica TaxID=95603 RepID=B8XX57_9EUCA|nr:ATP synthase F0 subunit 8 [Eriocheir japonica]ACJ44952.1 ATP synthase subunit 8 [Eriocheir japonica]UJM44179.1 ATP synthase F0 subunit 8 [Eriocheir japonica]
MPQMAPIYWLFMFFFFLASFLLFFALNYFIKPFYKVNFLQDNKKPLIYKYWKL